VIIRLDNYFSAFTNAIAEHAVPGSSVRECVAELCNRYPQLLVHLLDNDNEICKKAGLKLNGVFLIDEDAPNLPVGPEDVLELTLDIPTGDSKAVRFIAAAVLIVVGAVLMYTGIGAEFGVNLIIAGVSLLIQTAFFTPEMPDMGTLLENSSTYTFDGALNTTASGTPVQLIYGTHRVGGQVLNLFTEVAEGVENISGADVTSSYNYLYVQLGVSEGEVAGIEDVHINQLPVAFYNEISTAPDSQYMRLGSKTQEVMPDFAKVMNTTPVSRKVTSSGLPLVNTDVEFSEYEPIYAAIYANGFRTLTKADYHPGPYKLEVTSEEVTTYDGGGA